jgi:nucleoid-associated protein YgaU
VVKLLISAVAAAPASRGRATTPVAAHPIYNVRAGSRPASRPPALPRMPERKARRTVAMLAACVAALAFLGAFAPIALLRPSNRLPLATLPIAPAVQDAVQSAPAVPVAATGYRVRQGDTLWSIAGTILGDPSRWQEVWRSNAGTLMTDGALFLDPDLIRPGWKLRLPPR